MNYVYHASKLQGLKVIKPNKSTHNKSWVYAFRKPEFCITMIGNHNDFINQVGIWNGVPYIAERFAGALEYAFDGMSGSVYKLDGSGFKEGMTTFKSELVCDDECTVISESKINNTLEEIMSLSKQNKLLVYRYKNFPHFYQVIKVI